LNFFTLLNILESFIARRTAQFRVHFNVPFNTVPADRQATPDEEIRLATRQNHYLALIALFRRLP
jgi:hypothetical protein